MDHGKLMDNFIDESLGHLANIESGLIELERLGGRADYNLINGIFRSIHTIKGASGFLGLNNLGGLTHVMEDALSLLRGKKVEVSKELVSALFGGTDALKAMLGDIYSSDAMDIGVEIGNITQAAGISQREIKKVTVKEKLACGKNGHLAFDVPESELHDLIQQGSFLYFIRVFLKKDLTLKGQTPFDFINNMESTGRFLDAFLDFSVVAGLGDCLEAEMAFVFIYATVLEQDLVPLALDLPSDRIMEIDTEYLKEVYQQELTRFMESFIRNADDEEEFNEFQSQHDDGISEGRIAKDGCLSRNEDKIRVSVNAFDELMNLAAELVLGKNRLAQIVEPFMISTPGLDEVISLMSRVTAEISQMIMHMRMQPLSTLFCRYNRLVRDMANYLEKDAVIQTSGDEVELEKTIIEALSGPIAHIIRNSLDHGIEKPEFRSKAGKSPCGIINLKAFHDACSVYIEVTDDGAGLDILRIREKALENKMVSQEELAIMSDKDIVSLIFTPGFSTAGQVSDISGRGVGMDVVKTDIERIGGTVEIETSPGSGTTIRMTLPLKIVVISGRMVKAGSQTFIMPEADIAELVTLDASGIRDRIKTKNGVKYLILRDKFVPLEHLNNCLKITSEGKYVASDDFVRIIIVRAGDSLFGLLVDEFGDIAEIAVKPLPRFFEDMKWFGGASIMPDGSVSLILDVKCLMERSGLDWSVSGV